MPVDGRDQGAQSRRPGRPAGTSGGALTPIRGAVAFAALVAAPWICRGLTLMEEGVAPAAADLRGLAADAGVALLLLAPLWLLARAARWLPSLLAGLLALAYYGNHEAVLALGAVASPMDAAFLVDPTFVSGSLLAVGRPVVLIGLVGGSSVLAAWGLGPVSGRTMAVFAALGAAVLLALAVWPTDPRFTTWRQVNALAHNVQWLVRGGPGLGGDEAASGFPDPPTAMLDLVPGLAADLDAPARFPGGSGRNVLLVVLEGVSGFYLPTAAGAHGRSSVMRMHRLDRTFRENVGFNTFLTHQRRTNRGLYSILCGELPRLLSGMPKMTVAANGGWRRCLPEVLSDAGYETVYLQAAPLAFMLKDRFLPSIGFDTVRGHEYFRHHYLRTEWGVDDRAFFEHASELVEELQAGEKPWFLTLLTVGSHHPFVVPDDFMPGQGAPMQRAFVYLDDAFDAFLRRLDASGVRDDTLVLVTSDESAGDQGLTADRVASELTQNWGLAIVLLPERTRARIREPYAQQDLALSVVDHLGLAEQGEHFFGRSLFRDYDRGRSLFFSNLNFHTISGLDDQGLLVHCSYEGAECAGYDAFDGRVFSPVLREIDPDADFVETVREMSLRSRPPLGEAPLAIPLLADPVFELVGNDWQMVQGVVEISVRPHEWLEVEYEVEARGGPVDLRHYLTFGLGRVLLDSAVRIEPGRTARLRYSFASDEPIPFVSVRTNARLEEGSRGELLFKRRRLLLRRRGERPPAGVRIAEFSLDPPGEADRLIAKVTPQEEYREFLRELTEHGIGALGRKEGDDADAP
jgi:arylsulfatase A-like enzyme